MIFSIGTVCVILGFTLEGMRRASLLIRRRQLLLECLRLCKWMEREVSDRRTSISEMIDAQCETGSTLSDFLRLVQKDMATAPFHLVWKQNVSRYFTCLKKEDLNWLVKVSDAFKNIHIDSVEKELSFTIAGIQARYEEALDMEQKFVKIYRTIGFMTGCIAVLLLI